jgi:hypothetical protein
MARVAAIGGGDDGRLPAVVIGQLGGPVVEEVVVGVDADQFLEHRSDPPIPFAEGCDRRLHCGPGMGGVAALTAGSQPLPSKWA